MLTDAYASSPSESFLHEFNFQEEGSMNITYVRWC